MGVGAPLGCGEEWRSVTTAASEPVAQLDVAYGRGGVDGLSDFTTDNSVGAVPGTRIA